MLQPTPYSNLRLSNGSDPSGLLAWLRDLMRLCSTEAVACRVTARPAIAGITCPTPRWTIVLKIFIHRDT